MNNTKEKPIVKLVGEDGNAMAIIARCTSALKKAGYTKKETDKFLEEAMSGDYNHVLQTAMEWCEVE